METIAGRMPPGKPVELWVSAHFEYTGAVAYAGELYPHDLRHGEPEICDRSTLRRLDMTICYNGPPTMPGDNGRKIRVDMKGAIADSGTQEEHGVIQESPLSLLHLRHFGDKGGKLLDVEMVESFKFGADVLIALPVGHSMVINRFVEEPMDRERRSPALRAAHD